MDHRNHKKFSFLVLALQRILFLHVDLEAEIQTLYADDSFSVNRVGNDIRKIIMTFIVKAQTGIEKKTGFTESNEY